MKNIIKTQKGITLIALVITIVVMLILAGISINLIIGENGIFTKSKDAKESFENASAKEQLEMDSIASEMGGTIDSTVYDYVQKLKGAEVYNRLPYNSSHEVTASTIEAAVVTNGEVYVIYYDYYNKLKIEKEENDNIMMSDINGLETDLWLNTNIKRKEIGTIKFLNGIPSGNTIDITEKGHGQKVKLKSTLNAETNLYDIEIGAVGGVIAPKNCTYLFGRMTAITALDFQNNFYTNNTVNMQQMFNSIANISDFKLDKNFDTSNVYNMRRVFAYSKLTNIDLSLANFDTSNVENMGYMFYNIPSLTELNFGEKFSTKNVIDMGAMFWNMSNLTSLNLPNNFDTSNVESMKNMFGFNSSLSTIDFSSCNFDTSNVTNMEAMFSSCYRLSSINFGTKFNTEKVTSMANLFISCRSLTELDFGNKFSSASAITMTDMIRGCSALKKIKFGIFGRELNEGLTSSLNFYYDISNCEVEVCNEAVKNWLLNQLGSTNITITVKSI